MNDKIEQVAKRFTNLSKEFNNGWITKSEYLSKTNALSDWLKENKIHFETFIKLTEND